jgi:hypothetical protein
MFRMAEMTRMFIAVAAIILTGLAAYYVASVAIMGF